MIASQPPLQPAPILVVLIPVDIPPTARRAPRILRTLLDALLHVDGWSVANLLGILRVVDAAGDQEGFGFLRDEEALAVGLGACYLGGDGSRGCRGWEGWCC